MVQYEQEALEVQPARDRERCWEAWRPGRHVERCEGCGAYFHARDLLWEEGLLVCAWCRSRAREGLL